MWDEIEFHVRAPRYFAESLPLVKVFAEGTSRSFCSGSCLRFDVNIASKKLSGEGLFRDLYTSNISFWMFWWWIENDLFLLSKISNDDSKSSYTSLNALFLEFINFIVTWSTAEHPGHRRIFELSLYKRHVEKIFLFHSKICSESR